MHWSEDMANSILYQPKSEIEDIPFEKELEHISNSYELVLNHRNFTGRSGTMFSYEGIGSIYWHMVSELLLATQENFFLAKNNNSSERNNIQSLGRYYYKIREGLSAAKTPKEYGAFPFDPYSHTPSHSGAQQPGMTGQVKEEILTRFGELGCFVQNGCIVFDTALLSKEEFLIKNQIFTYFDISKTKRSLKILKNQLAYTFCQVPIVYTLSKQDCRINLILKDNSNIKIEGNFIVEPFNPFFASAIIYPFLILIFAPIFFNANKCRSTGRVPIAQPPGRETFAFLYFVNNEPRTNTPALIVLTSLYGAKVFILLSLLKTSKVFCFFNTLTLRPINSKSSIIVKISLTNGMF